MHRKTDLQRWCSDVKAADAFLIYDVLSGKVDQELTDYGLYLLDKLGLAKITAHGILLNLVVFRRYLDRHGVMLSDVTDQVLTKFRDSEKALVMANPKSFRKESYAEDTVNKKLRCVYKWLLWLQDNKRIRSGAVGPVAARVNSCVSTLAEQVRKAEKRTTSILAVCPLLFKRSASSDRHLLKPVVSRSQQETMVERFMNAKQSEYVRERNALMADIGAEIGFRRGSVNSLRVDQFDPEIIRNVDADAIKVLPVRQKFGYDNEFDFPTWLALRVVEFAEGPLERFLDEKKLANFSGQLFLSEKTGKPLTDGAITRIFSGAARSAGAKKGAAYHSMRRLYAGEKVDAVISDLLEKGMDTSTESIARTVATSMGQRNWESLLPYVSRAQSNSGLSRRASYREVKNTLEAAQAEADQLRKKIQELEAKLTASSRG
jgi:integrase